MKKRTNLVLITLCVAFIGCGVGDESGRCAEMTQAMSRCYPNVSAAAKCTAETTAMFDALGADAASCKQISGAGKADWFAFGGCAKNEHVCGLIFCCDDSYSITRQPTQSEWSFVEQVKDYQAATPSSIKGAIAALSSAELREMKSFTFRQSVVEKPNAAAKTMAVEISLGLIDVPYETFISRFDPSKWGLNLAMYIGGERKVKERDAQGRPVLQVERMVLSPFPCTLESPLSNMDMTKVEAIEYSTTKSTVYWRVYSSDNSSTEADVGKVSFEAKNGGTLVTFHSAHRLNFAGGLHIPLAAVELTLKTYFIEHIKKYRDLASR